MQPHSDTTDAVFEANTVNRLSTAQMDQIYGNLIQLPPEDLPHGFVHGDMAPLTNPYDPHHSLVKSKSKVRRHHHIPVMGKPMPWVPQRTSRWNCADIPVNRQTGDIEGDVRYDAAFMDTHDLGTFPIIDGRQSEMQTVFPWSQPGEVPPELESETKCVLF